MGHLRQLLQFVRSCFKKFIITLDMDAREAVEPTLQAMGLKRDKDYFAIGKDAPGKKCIEGLLPDSVFQAVYSSNLSVVQKLSSGSPADAKSAKSELKRLYLSEFKRAIQPAVRELADFYKLARKIDNAMKS